MTTICTLFSPSDAAEWDDFVSRHPQGTFFHQAAWAEVLRVAFGHTPHFLLARRGDLPPRGVPMAGPLQHQTTALPMPPFQPRDLRKDPDDRYAARSRLTTNPVSTTWGQGPASFFSLAEDDSMGQRSSMAST